MMKPNLSNITQMMRKAVDRMQRDGAIRPGNNKIVRLQEVFPFRPDEVEGIGYAGAEVRFHLRNGRVFDGNGKAVDAPLTP